MAADKETGVLGWVQKVGLSGEEEVDPAPPTWGLPGVGQVVCRMVLYWALSGASLKVRLG